MIGNATLTVNKATMLRAINEYLDRNFIIEVKVTDLSCIDTYSRQWVNANTSPFNSGWVDSNEYYWYKR